MEINWLYLILFIVGFFALIVVLQMLSNRVAESNKQQKGDKTVGQTASQTGADLGRDVAKSTFVWTISSMLVEFFRSFIVRKKK